MTQIERPRPPECLFDIEAKPFAPAHEVWEWIGETILDQSSPVYNPDHEHLSQAMIGFLWTVKDNNRKGRRIIGQCECGSPQGAMGKWARARAEQQVMDWFGSVPDFIITLDANYCSQCSDAEFMALVEHEMYHAAQDVDPFGMPRFNKQTGKPVFTVRGHDVEEFVGVVRRYGADASGVRALVDAANRPAEISNVSIAHACGTCQLRVA